jgi:hypothetical protein
VEEFETATANPNLISNAFFSVKNNKIRSIIRPEGKEFLGRRVGPALIIDITTTDRKRNMQKEELAPGLLLCSYSEVNMRCFRAAVSFPGGSTLFPLTLTPTEYHEIWPDATPRFVTILFLRGYVQLLPLAVIETLRAKCPVLHVVDAVGRVIDRADDLEELDGDSLAGMAEAYGIDYDNMTPPELRLMIRNQRNESERERRAAAQ